MELSQVVEGLRTERNKTAAQLATLDAATAPLTVTARRINQLTEDPAQENRLDRGA
jgi:hypothetical protein